MRVAGGATGALGDSGVEAVANAGGAAGEEGVDVVARVGAHSEIDQLHSKGRRVDIVVKGDDRQTVAIARNVHIEIGGGAGGLHLAVAAHRAGAVDDQDLINLVGRILDLIPI